LFFFFFFFGKKIIDFLQSGVQGNDELVSDSSYSQQPEYSSQVKSQT